MNYKTEKELAEKYFQECLDILTKKANDYAKDSDVFSNFKKISTMADIPTSKSFVMFMAVKLARIIELLEKPNKVDESIKDSCQDIANYSYLLYAYLKERR